jgi:hypothetical protein
MSAKVQKISKALVGIFLLGCVFLSYQNCSKVAVESLDSKTSASTAAVAGGAGGATETPPGDVICNPLDSATKCDLSTGDGLIGNLYYLTAEQKSLFQNDLNKANLDDYVKYGTQVPKKVLMSDVNVPPQSWDAGFWLPDGSAIKDLNGNMLFEYFSIVLEGYISLPAGSYQFAFMSDDGMRATIDGAVAAEDDGVHAPRWKCGTANVNFDGTNWKNLKVQYFQGPRVDIAMQFYYRSSSLSGNACGATGGWKIVPASSLRWKK